MLRVVFVYIPRRPWSPRGSQLALHVIQSDFNCNKVEQFSVKEFLGYQCLDIENLTTRRKIWKPREAAPKWLEACAM